jgi:hypothetical protein
MIERPHLDQSARICPQCRAELAAMDAEIAELRRSIDECGWEHPTLDASVRAHPSGRRDALDEIPGQRPDLTTVPETE